MRTAQVFCGKEELILEVITELRFRSRRWQILPQKEDRRVIRDLLHDLSPVKIKSSYITSAHSWLSERASERVFELCESVCADMQTRSSTIYDKNTQICRRR